MLWQELTWQNELYFFLWEVSDFTESFISSIAQWMEMVLDLCRWLEYWLPVQAAICQWLFCELILSDSDGPHDDPCDVSFHVYDAFPVKLKNGWNTDKNYRILTSYLLVMMLFYFLFMLLHLLVNFFFVVDLMMMLICQLIVI